MEPERSVSIPPPVTGADDEDLSSVAALGDPLRRALYRYVIAQTAPVNRDQVAHAVGVARHTAKFHLDRLVTDGLLDIEYARPPGRGGPGAGRPAKLYRRSSRDRTVTLPPRHYDLAGRLLARAVTDAQHTDLPIGDALATAARDWGRTLASDLQQRGGDDPNTTTPLATLTSALTDAGYEPRTDPDGVVLVNCPFHALAQEYTDHVCGMNLELIHGLINGLEQTELKALLDPAPGRCCVRLVPTNAGPPTTDPSDTPV